MKKFLLIFTTLFLLTIMPFNKITNAQDPGWFGTRYTCATDHCDIRLYQNEVFFIYWELEVRCLNDSGNYVRGSYSGSGVYPGSLCNGAVAL